MTSEPNVIFTYGTLRPDLGDRPEAHAFRASATHLGPASFQGKLYAISWYPGVVDSTDPSDRVTGDLYEIGTGPDFFEKLDTYEGCAPPWPEPYEYIRAIRDVTFNGRTESAWIYLFNWPITNQTCIESGDFANHTPRSR
ncbi:MAG: gamma-glutamylcyclotransferase [Silicimonas sp.]|nr:gamma-glutamylcyclotransferase [Silicimonas sp.]